ncbi:MAG: ATP-dependent metallopeptidase FtsH/Yme1/Tma family protein [Victivallaceae bacterium]
MTYDDFIRQVETKKVKSVTLDDFSTIEGTMFDGTTTKEFRSYGRTGTANDPLLTQFLKEHNVVVSMRDMSKPSHTMPMITGLMFLIAPIAFLILLIVIIRKLNQILAIQRNNQRPTAPYSEPEGKP